MADSSIIRQGFLVKKGHVRHNWRTRWFTLNKQELRYYRNREDRTPAGAINLARATLTCLTMDDYKKPWVIQIRLENGHEYLIQAPDLTVRDEWKTAIEDVVRSLERLEFSPDRSTMKLIGGDSLATTTTKRDIVHAMQDRSGGVRLLEFKCKGERQNIKYFSGSAILDWLISWSFCSSRRDALKFVSSLLRQSYFHPVRIDFNKGQCINLKDNKAYNKEVADTDDAYYIFVCFAPGEENDVFGNSDGESDSESDDDILSSRMPTVHVNTNPGDPKVLKQGFLRKKGHLRHNWRPRLFVLREKQEHIFYYRGSKQMSKPLGTIPLRGLSVLALDNEGDAEPRLLSLTSPPATNGSSEAITTPRSKRSSKLLKLKVNRILLTTTTGGRIMLEAATSDDRDSWVAEINIASKMISR
ncbi:pleckstrin-2-like [Halichondria panicea]|uniref:pleckstrin-2-like n=1 Tax=Halichondria panicea TaxID=6063 RepID=UPI00312B8C75